MALYYNLVFGLLVIEVVFFTILSLPYPRKIRRTVLTTVSAPFRNEQFQIALKCILGFVLVLFIDSVNRVISVTDELKGQNNIAQGIVNDRSEIQARRFYAQRNMYLCGFTLFLTLILLRTYSLVTELLVTKDQVDTLSTDKGVSVTKTNDDPEITKLKKQLADKDKELDDLKQKSKALSDDYEGKETITTKKVDGSGLRSRKA